MKYRELLYKLLKISLFIGPKRPRGKSSNCHINWLARAGRSILVTKFRADVLVPLSHSAAHNSVSIERGTKFGNKKNSTSFLVCDLCKITAHAGLIYIRITPLWFKKKPWEHFFILYLSQLISFHCLTFCQKLYNKTVNDF